MKSVFTTKLFQGCFLLSLLCIAGVAMGQSAVEKVDSLVQPYIDSETLDGMCLGILHQGKSTVRGYGKVGSGSDKPTGDTLYEIGSITKVFTGLLLANAVNQKKVRLDQPMIELFPKKLSAPHESLAKINLVHLSTHTSGLPRLPSNIDLSDIDDPYSKYTPELMFEFLHDHKLVRKPGNKNEYSNFAVGLLGWLIANHQDANYESLLRQRILEPLAMNDTTITLSEAQRPRLAQGHELDGIKRSPWQFDALVSAGGIRSSVNDMLKFAAANLKPAGPLAEDVELTWKIHQPAIGKEKAMGLGWLAAEDGKTRFHNGQTGGYHSMLLIGRELDLAVVALSSTANGEVDRLAEDVFKLLAGENVEPRKFEPKVKVADEILQKYVGIYELVPSVRFTVSTQDGKLMVGLTGQPTFRVYPKSETEFEYKVVKATITFRKDKEGLWNELVLFQNGIRQKAVRVNNK
jgi:serine-type D-Ala-D-Ala carboxypeptidase/endopeptidase